MKMNTRNLIAGIAIATILPVCGAYADTPIPTTEPATGIKMLGTKNFRSLGVDMHTVFYPPDSVFEVKHDYKDGEVRVNNAKRDTFGSPTHAAEGYFSALKALGDKCVHVGETYVETSKSIMFWVDCK